MTPDFSSIQSLDAAKALAVEGKLVPVLLFPAEFGGEEVSQNIVYVTPEAAAARERIIGTLTGMIEDDAIDNMKVLPTYKGDSFVPSAITMKAWHSGKAGGFEPTIEIW